MSQINPHADKVEIARLLARFKLGVRRHLDLSVNLERLQSEPDYAREQFELLEERIEDEDLLVLLLTLRDQLLHNPMPEPAPLVTLEPRVAPPPERYRFGPRC